MNKHHITHIVGFPRSGTTFALNLIKQHPKLTHLTNAMISDKDGSGNESGYLISETKRELVEKLPPKRYVEKTPLHALHIQGITGYFIAMVRNPDDAIASAIAAPFIKKTPEELEKLYNAIYKNLYRHKKKVIFLDYDKLVSNISYIEQVFEKIKLKPIKVKFVIDPPIKNFFNKKEPYKASRRCWVHYDKCKKLCL